MEEEEEDDDDDDDDDDEEEDSSSEDEVSARARFFFLSSRVTRRASFTRMDTVLTRLFSDQNDESMDAIDPTAILPSGRRTRGVKVDYTSQEALQKAGLKSGEDDDDEDDAKMKE
jgi:hypothetical protein